MKNENSTFTKGSMATALFLCLIGSASTSFGYYSEFVGGYCTPEQETAAMEASRAAQAKPVTVQAAKGKGIRYYSEFLGRYGTLEEENAAVAASRKAQEEQPAVIKLAARLDKKCYYSDYTASYICD